MGRCGEDRCQSTSFQTVSRPLETHAPVKKPRERVAGFMAAAIAAKGDEASVENGRDSVTPPSLQVVHRRRRRSRDHEEKLERPDRETATPDDRLFSAIPRVGIRQFLVCLNQGGVACRFNRRRLLSRFGHSLHSHSLFPSPLFHLPGRAFLSHSLRLSSSRKKRYGDRPGKRSICRKRELAGQHGKSRPTFSSHAALSLHSTYSYILPISLVLPSLPVSPACSPFQYLYWALFPTFCLLSTRQQVSPSLLSLQTKEIS